MSPLSNPRHEAFAQAVAKGATRSAAARSAGYSPTRAGSQGCVLAKAPKIIARIAQLTARASQETARIIAKGVKQAANAEDQLVASVAVTKAWVLQVLQRNIEEARADKQYGVVKGSVELAAKVAGVYVERTDHKIDFPTDLAQCTEEQLIALENLVLTLNYGPDEAKKREVRRRLELEAGMIVDTTAEKVGETARSPELSATIAAPGDPAVLPPTSAHQTPNRPPKPSWLNLSGAERIRFAEIWSARGPARPDGFKEWAIGRQVEWLDKNWAIGRTEER